MERSKHSLIESAQKKTNFSQKNLLVLTVFFVISIVLAALGGYYFGQKQAIYQANQQQSTIESVLSVAPTQLPTPTKVLPTGIPFTKVQIPAGWNTYSSDKLEIKIMYPPNLYIKEFGSEVVFAFEPFPEEEISMGPLDYIKIGDDYSNEDFDAVYEASEGNDVPEVHSAVDVNVKKLKNYNFDGYYATEYIHDGVTGPFSNLGRGPVGYSHRFLIKKNDKIIELINTSMTPEMTKLRDDIFFQMLSSLEIN